MHLLAQTRHRLHRLQRPQQPQRPQRPYRHAPIPLLEELLIGEFQQAADHDHKIQHVPARVQVRLFALAETESEDLETGL